MLNLYRLPYFASVGLVRLSNTFLYPSHRILYKSLYSTSDDNLSDNHIDNDTIEKSMETTTIANHTFRKPTEANLKSLERQIFHSLQPSQVFCVSSNLCKHGHPQAFGFHPTNGNRPVSGMFRLTCPLLVQAIDKWEGQGGVRELSDWLTTNDRTSNLTAQQKKIGYEQANQVLKEVRMELTKNHIHKLKSTLGEYNAQRFLESGIAGIPSNKAYDVKCIHAHVADDLCRSKGNVIGKYALHKLQEKGVSVTGNDVCWQQCNVNHDRQENDWFYVPRKNKQKLRTTRKRRQQLRKDDQDVLNS